MFYNFLQLSSVLTAVFVCVVSALFQCCFSTTTVTASRTLVLYASQGDSARKLEMMVNSR